jgi:uncharacterized protein (DUF302 family)
VVFLLNSGYHLSNESQLDGGFRMQIDYTRPTTKSYAQAIEAVKDAAVLHGFSVGFVHDLGAKWAQQGIEREPVSIVEICNAGYASQVLDEDILIGLMLPCPVMVYAQDGDVLISTMRPTLIREFFPNAEIDDVAATVECKVFAIVDEAAGA